MTTTTLQVWADVLCPWCWMGHRRLAQAIAESGVPARIEHRSFLLGPEGPGPERRRIAETATAEWGMSPAEWGRRRDRIEQAGRAQGLTIRMDTAWALDSRPAHRVLKLAAARGLDETAAWEAMFAAHLRDNLDLAEWSVLANLKTGLERDEVLALGDNEEYAAEVLADHEEGQSRGIRSVPTVGHGDRLLAGARSVEELAEFVRSAAKAVA
ncbi:MULTISPECIES: DsbA family protein [Actinomycetes]|uniref:DsbA family oxidoreductase n=1 Tax=Actinomycetes TaxID=1760 RepID=UPI0001B5406D|nr:MULTISPECIES: DsbA family protein [Actinomycetes]